jgi:DNA-binding NarL/FixJ family response regulator
MSSHIARKVVAFFRQIPEPVHDYEKLSIREQEVLECLARGFLYREIADKLKISYTTVHTHIRHIYEKLHVRSRTQAVAKHFQQVGSSNVSAKESAEKSTNQKPFE